MSVFRIVNVPKPLYGYATCRMCVRVTRSDTVRGTPGRVATVVCTRPVCSDFRASHSPAPQTAKSPKSEPRSDSWYYRGATHVTSLTTVHYTGETGVGGEPATADWYSTVARAGLRSWAWGDWYELRLRALTGELTTPRPPKWASEAVACCGVALAPFPTRATIFYAGDEQQTRTTPPRR
jgi:hypothetical protein